MHHAAAITAEAVANASEEAVSPPHIVEAVVEASFIAICLSPLCTSCDPICSKVTLWCCYSFWCTLWRLSWELHCVV